MASRWTIRDGRSSVLSWLVAFAVLQVGLAVMVERWWPQLRDPEHATKSRLLRKQMEANPDQPLALVLGSSRVLNGLRPELLPHCPSPEGETLIFNMGMTAHGPLHQLMTLRRVLANGIKPRWVFIEILPGLLAEEVPAEYLLQAKRLGWGDLPVAGRHAQTPPRLYLDWACARLVPWFTSRFCLMNHLAPSWVPEENRTEEFWQRIGRMGWLELPAPRDRKELIKATQHAWARYALALHSFQISPGPDRALRELLDLCQRENITPALLVMPESSYFLRWYAPRTHVLLQAYLKQLSTDYQVPVIDARNWVPDKGFRDGHHLVTDGATLFTRRFGREALQPLLARELQMEGAVAVPPYPDKKTESRRPQSSAETGVR